MLFTNPTPIKMVKQKEANYMLRKLKFHKNYKSTIIK